MQRTVYAISNTVTGEAYIGQTRDTLAWRWMAHRSRLRAGKHHNRAWQFAYDRDGEAAFVLLVLEQNAQKETTKGGILSGDYAAEREWLAHARAAGIVLYNDQVQRGRRKAA